MRTREEILKEINAATAQGAKTDQVILGAILNVLLDIRDLLTSKKPENFI